MATKSNKAQKRGKGRERKAFEGIPTEWYTEVKEYNPETKKSKLFFICKVDGCNRKFKKSSNIFNHFRFHDGRQPYQCHLCSKRFTQSGNLQKHYQKCHPGQNMQLENQRISDTPLNQKRSYLKKRDGSPLDEMDESPRQRQKL